MEKNKKPILTIEPVSWAGKNVLKYQASISVNVPGRKKPIAIYGDPFSTEEKAKESLIEELSAWNSAVKSFTNVLVPKE